MTSLVPSLNVGGLSSPSPPLFLPLPFFPFAFLSPPFFLPFLPPSSSSAFFAASSSGEVGVSVLKRS